MKAWHLLENLFHGHFGVKAHVYRHIHHVWRYLRQKKGTEHNVYAMVRNRIKKKSQPDSGGKSNRYQLGNFARLRRELEVCSHVYLLHLPFHHWQKKKKHSKHRLRSKNTNGTQEYVVAGTVFGTMGTVLPRFHSVLFG
jgi:hypothetical protein